MAEFKAVARGMRLDRAAIEAAVTLPWSQGQVEGHVNRLKVLKRQGYGRCGFDLLRRRVLHRAC
jgi:transposase